jgi:hypothetical protein
MWVRGGTLHEFHDMRVGAGGDAACSSCLRMEFDKLFLSYRFINLAFVNPREISELHTLRR